MSMGDLIWERKVPAMSMGDLIWERKVPAARPQNKIIEAICDHRVIEEKGRAWFDISFALFIFGALIILFLFYGEGVTMNHIFY